MIVNFGSVNIDHVYRVARMPQPAETVVARSYRRYLGGKGANQSIAIVRSGGEVRHVGAIGPDGNWMAEELRTAGVDPSRLARVDEPTGHAIIVVDDAGENQILVSGGANLCISPDRVEKELSALAGGGHWVLLQNEVNGVPDIVARAKAAGFTVAYSAAPFVAEAAMAVIDDVDLLALNQLEAEALAKAAGTTVADLPVAQLLVTRGAEGAFLRAGGTIIEQPAFAVTALDTTGAGDSFLGAFLARCTSGAAAAEAMRYAAAAAALQVTRPGAAAAIPYHAEVMRFLAEKRG